MSSTVLEGTLLNWTLDPTGKAVREHVVVFLPYGEARAAFRPDPYKAASGRGEQREQIPAHVRKLRQEMEAGNYTPTAISVGLRPRHQKEIVRKGETVRLTVSHEDPLPLTDGGHRFAAIGQIHDDAMKAEDKTLLDLVLKLPVTALVLLDGDTQADFINLQQGRSVDAAHLLSLKLHAKLLDGEAQALMKVAFDVVRVLNEHGDSPFCKLIRFDSRAGPRDAVIARLPITTLTARGSSDLATSLFGLARIVGPASDIKKVSYSVVQAFKTVKKQAPELLEEGKPLTPPTEGGTKGSATVLVGLGVVLAYRVKALGREIPGKDDLETLVKAAKNTLERSIEGNFSSQVKRALMGELASEFLADLEVEKHEGIPIGLLRDLSCSTFGRSPLPKQSAETKDEGKEASKAQ